jgi:hypothetical protein
VNDVLERRFAAMGAHVSLPERPWRGSPRIDVASDGFVISFAGSGAIVDAEVIDVRPRDRHLLLLVRDGDEKSKFLCGHDERDWFVAAIPENARGVTGVTTAKIALQPDPVKQLVARVKPKDRFRRRNEAYVRQGEWFFVPATPRPEPPASQVLRNEPLMRSPGAKPHVMQYAYRRGGSAVWVNPRSGASLGDAAYRKLSDKQRRTGAWQRLIREPEVYAKGAVRHSDHATIRLASWHRVLMNTEGGARAMRYVVFYD